MVNINGILAWIGYFLAAYLLVVLLIYFAMMIFAVYKINRNRRYERTMDLLSNTEAYNLGVSVLVPAFNEEQGIVQNVSSLLNLNYKRFEIIVVNDGSTDATADLLINQFLMKPVQNVTIEQKLKTAEVESMYVSNLFPNLKLVNKLNGGKADALNCGINVSTMEYVCTVDGDSVLEKDSMKTVMRPFVLEGDRVAAVGGTVELINENRVNHGVADKQIEFSPNPLVAMQTIEYFRSFLIGRVALSELNLMLICSGAFSVFDKAMLIENGGLARNVIGEDMEIVVRLQKNITKHRLNKLIVHVPDAICYTEAPETLKVLRRQRRRWHQGLLESLTAHMEVWFNPRFRALGVIAFPYFIMVEAFIPFVEVLGIAYLIAGFFVGQVFVEFSLFLLMLSLIYAGLMNTISVMLHSWQQDKYPDAAELAYVLGLSFTEAFWFKPLMLFWRLEGFYRFFTKRSDWGVMDRRGFSESKPEVVS